MVRGDMECLHEVEAEISRWRDILAAEYAQFLRGELILYPIVDLHQTLTYSVNNLHRAIYLLNRLIVISRSFK